MLYPHLGPNHTSRIMWLTSYDKLQEGHLIFTYDSIVWFSKNKISWFVLYFNFNWLFLKSLSIPVYLSHNNRHITSLICGQQNILILLLFLTALRWVLLFLPMWIKCCLHFSLIAVWFIFLHCGKPAIYRLNFY